MFHSSGRWFLGSHWPKSSRRLTTRSLARAFSSSRRPPPKTPSKRCARDGLEQRLGLQRVAGAVGALAQPAVVDPVLHRGDLEAQPEPLDRRVAVGEHLGEVVAGVDVQHRERDRGRPERLRRDVQHDDGVLAAAEEQHRPLELGGDLADDEHRLALEHVELARAPAGRPAGRRSVGGHVGRHGERLGQGVGGGHEGSSRSIWRSEAGQVPRAHAERGTRAWAERRGVPLTGAARTRSWRTRPSARRAGRRRARRAGCTARSRSTGSRRRAGGSPARGGRSA